MQFFLAVNKEHPSRLRMNRVISGSRERSREPSFPELGRISVFIAVMVCCFANYYGILVSFHYKSCGDIKLMIVTFYNCDIKLYFDNSSVLLLEMN